MQRLFHDDEEGDGSSGAYDPIRDADPSFTPSAVLRSIKLVPSEPGTFLWHFYHTVESELKVTWSVVSFLYKTVNAMCASNS